jgi:hypothetical protein
VLTILVNEYFVKSGDAKIASPNGVGSILEGILNEATSEYCPELGSMNPYVFLAPVLVSASTPDVTRGDDDDVDGSGPPFGADACEDGEPEVGDACEDGDA